MTKCQQLAAGLALIGDSVTRVSFYNSSGGDAGFTLSRPLTGAEQVVLSGLGFQDYWERDGRTSIYFPEF